MSFNGHAMVIPNFEEIILSVNYIILNNLHCSRVRDFNIKTLMIDISEIEEMDEEVLVIDLDQIDIHGHGVTALLKSHGFTKIGCIHGIQDAYLIRRD